MRSHEENRSILCGICFKKKDLRNISDTQLRQLQELIDSSYSLTDTHFQKVLCKVCALDLAAHTKNPGNPGRKLLKPKYSSMRFPPVHSTRANDDSSCPCTVCEIARITITPGAFQQAIPQLQQKYWNMLYPDTPYPVVKDKAKPSPVVEPIGVHIVTV